MVVYFDGSNIYKPFGDGMDDNFLDIRTRIRNQWDSMPLNLVSNGDKFPISDAIRTERIELLKKYAPKKNVKNY